MLQNNELRNGNFVQHDHEGILEVIGTGLTGFASKNGAGSVFKFHYEDCDGVTLTPDILEDIDWKDPQKLKRITRGVILNRVKFMELDDKNIWLFTSFGKTFLIHPLHEGFNISFRSIEGGFEIPLFFITYLHELQNLFYDLTKTELKFKQ